MPYIKRIPRLVWTVRAYYGADPYGDFDYRLQGPTYDEEFGEVGRWDCKQSMMEPAGWTDYTPKTGDVRWRVVWSTGHGEDVWLPQDATEQAKMLDRYGVKPNQLVGNMARVAGERGTVDWLNTGEVHG